MKKIIFIFIILLLTGLTKAQTNDVLVEFCTGTWCQWCPCGDQVADGILMNHPNTLVLAYHGGGGGDPFQNFNGNNIISILAYTGYPEAAIGRRVGQLTYGSWSGNVNAQGSNYPSPLTLRFIKTMDSVSRTVNLTVQATALRDIDTNVYVNFVITEDNVIYSQTGNSGAGCIGGSNYVHKWIVRNMVNGATGEAL